MFHLHDMHMHKNKFQKDKIPKHEKTKILNFYEKINRAIFMTMSWEKNLSSNIQKAQIIKKTVIKFTILNFQTFVLPILINK